MVGNTYYARVYHDGVTQSSTANFDIFIYKDPVPGPANNHCVNATTIEVGDTCTPVTGVANGSKTMAACTGDPIGEVWYQFTATQSTTYIDVQGIRNFDGVVQLLEACDPRTSLHCIDDTHEGGLERVVANSLKVGQTYFIRVHDHDSVVTSDNIALRRVKCPKPY